MLAAFGYGGGCSERTDAAGVLKGFIDAQKELYGRMPSLASSWLTRE